MKKIKLTENQLTKLLSFIMEVDNQDKKDEKKKKKLYDEIKNEFVTQLKNAKVCDDIIVYTGEDNGKEWIKETIKTMTFRVSSIGKDGLLIKLIDAKGGIDLKIGTVYSINIKRAFNLSDNTGFIILDERQKVKDKEGNETYNYLPIKIDNVLTCEIIENKNDCEQDIPDSKIHAEKVAKEWMKSIDKILTSQIYEPGLFGMDNMFFFPKGFKAMDSILSKYGLSVKKNEYDDFKTDTIVFKVIGASEKSTLLNKEIKGVINYKNDIEVKDYYFEIDNNVELKKGAEIKAKLYTKTKTSSLFRYDVTIQILGFNKVKSDTKKPKNNDNSPEQPKNNNNSPEQPNNNNNSREQPKNNDNNSPEQPKNNDNSQIKL